MFIIFSIIKSLLHLITCVALRIGKQLSPSLTSFQVLLAGVVSGVSKTKNDSKKDCRNGSKMMVAILNIGYYYQTTAVNNENFANWNVLFGGQIDLPFIFSDDNFNLYKNIIFVTNIKY